MGSLARYDAGAVGGFAGGFLHGGIPPLYPSPASAGEGYFCITMYYKNKIAALLPHSFRKIVRFFILPTKAFSQKGQ